MQITPYRIKRFDAIALAFLCWLGATGFAVEKIYTDGIESYTVLFMVPVLTIAIGLLFHEAISRTTDFRWISGFCCAALGVLALCVTLPASIGSAGGARDKVRAVASQSSEIAQRVRDDLARTDKLVAEARRWQTKECRTGRGPKCKSAGFVLRQRIASQEKLQRQLAKLKPAKAPMSGERRLAGLAAAAGWNITAEQIFEFAPMLPPVVAELLCAFCLWLGLEIKPARREPPPEPKSEDAEPVPSETMLTDIDPTELPNVVQLPPKRSLANRPEVSWSQLFKAEYGRAPRIDELQAAFPDLPKSSAHRYAKAA